jgi:hypothetical protein
MNNAAMFISIGTKKNKFKQNDKEILVKYVQEGGTLFITPEPKKKPPNKLVEAFGFQFGEKAIRDKKNHGVFNDHIIVRDFQDHPANEEVDSVQFGDFGCYPIYLSQNTGVPIAYSSKDANPANSIVAADIPYGEGRVLAIGQCRLFIDYFLGEKDNVIWLKNIIDYGLSTDKTIVPDAASAQQISTPINSISTVATSILEDTEEPKSTKVTTQISKETNGVDSPNEFRLKFCTNCGTKLEQSYKFCSNCGHKIT